MPDVYLETLEGDGEPGYDYYIPGPNAGSPDELGRFFPGLFRFSSRAFLPRLALSRVLPKAVAKRVLPPAKKSGVAKIVHNANKSMRALEQIQNQLTEQEASAPIPGQTDFSADPCRCPPARQAYHRPVSVPDDEYVAEHDEELYGYDFAPGEGVIVEELSGDFGFSAITSAALPALETAALPALKSGAISAIKSGANNLFKKRRRNSLQRYLPLILAQQSQARAASAQRSVEPTPYSSRSTTPDIVPQAHNPEQQWYQRPAVWAGIGAGTVAAGTLIYLVTRK